MLESLIVVYPQAVQVAPAPQAPQQAPSASDVFERAFGRSQALPPQFQYPIFLDDEPIGNVDVVVGATAEATTLAGRELIEALAPLLDNSVTDQLSVLSSAAPDGRVTLAQVRSVGLDASFDNQLLALRLEIPLELRQRRVLTRSERYIRELAQSKPPEPFSVILNSRVDLLFGDDRGDYQRLPASGSFDLAVNVRGAVLETGVDIRENLESNTPLSSLETVRRKLTTLTWDDPARARRLQAGDVRSAGSGFVPFSPILGITWGRDYTLQPFRERRPRNLQDFEIASDSLVDIYVNGVLARTLRLTPGRYSLSDLPVIQTAANVIEVVTRDGLGQETRQTFDAFTSTSLLAVGETDWGISAGIERFFDRGVIQYEQKRAVVSGFYERGLTDTFTAGGAARLASDGGVVSGLAVTATRVGSFSLRAAASSYDELGSGAAFDLTYNYQQASSGLRTGIRFNGTLGWRSENFASVSSNTPIISPEWTVAATVSGPVSTNGGWFLSGSYASIRDRQDSSSVTAGGSWSFGRAQVSASVGYIAGSETGRFERDEAVVRFQISWRLGDRRGVTAGYDSRLGNRNIDYYSNSVPGVGALDYRLGYRGTDNGDGLTGEINYTANRFEARASQEYETFVTTQGPNDVLIGERDRLRTRASFSTAVVYAGGSVALSRPVIDSFAMVRPHRDLNGAPIGINPDLTDLNGVVYQAKSGPLGPAVLPDIYPYRPQVVTAQPLDALRSAASPNDTPVFAKYRSGVVIDYGQGGGVALIGILRDDTGAPVRLRSGIARPVDDPEAQGALIFSNESGRFYAEGLVASQTYVVTMPGEPVLSGRLVVPDDARGIVRDFDLVLSSQRDNP